MRQSRKLASLARAPKQGGGGEVKAIEGRILDRLHRADQRIYDASTLEGMGEKMDLTNANRVRMAKYRARFGLSPLAE